MNDSIAALWLRGLAPPRDGLYRVTGPCREAEVDGAKLEWFDLGPQIDLDELSNDPDDLTIVDVSVEVAIADGYLVCGDGAHGSEGFLLGSTPNAVSCGSCR